MKESGENLVIKYSNRIEIDHNVVKIHKRLLHLLWALLRWRNIVGFKRKYGENKNYLTRDFIYLLKKRQTNRPICHYNQQRKFILF